MASAPTSRMSIPSHKMNYAISPNNYSNQELEYPYSSSSGSREASPIYHPGYYTSSSPSVNPMVSSTFSYPTHLSDVYHHEQPEAHPLPSQYWSNQGICYASAQPVQNASLDTIHSSEVPLHAPVPLPGYPPLLSRPNPEHNNHYSMTGIPEPMNTSLPLAQPNSEAGVAHFDTQFPQHQDILDFYARASEQTFPTPSELLSQLTGVPQCSTIAEPEKKFESQRKARHRAVAQSVGFEPTDPDTISSHDKKRHYLECLEAYVVFLHEQLSLVGEPVSLERVSTYRGLSSRSIRTLLVHMENTTRKLNLKTIDEEDSFITLRDGLVVQDAAAAAAIQTNTRHSVSTGSTSNGRSYSMQ